MNILLMDNINWALLLYDFLGDGMNSSIAFGLMLFVASFALVAVAVVWQMLGGYLRPSSHEESSSELL